MVTDISSTSYLCGSKVAIQALGEGKHELSVDSPHKGPVTGKDITYCKLMSDPGVGVNNPISSFPLFSRFFTTNTGHLWFNLTSIFDRCRHSSAAVTPVKYKRDSINLMGIFAKCKKILNREIN